MLQTILNGCMSMAPRHILYLQQTGLTQERPATSVGSGAFLYYMLSPLAVIAVLVAAPWPVFVGVRHGVIILPAIVGVLVASVKMYIALAPYRRTFVLLLLPLPVSWLRAALVGQPFLTVVQAAFARVSVSLVKVPLCPRWREDGSRIAPAAPEVIEVFFLVPLWSFRSSLVRVLLVSGVPWIVFLVLHNYLI